MAEVKWKRDGISYLFRSNRATLLMSSGFFPSNHLSAVAVVQVRNQTRACKTGAAIASAGKHRSRLAMSAVCEVFHAWRPACAYS